MYKSFITATREFRFVWSNPAKGDMNSFTVGAKRTSASVGRLLMPVELLKHKRVKNNACVVYRGCRPETLVALEYLLPFWENKFTGLDIYLSSDLPQYVHSCGKFLIWPEPEASNEFGHISHLLDDCNEDPLKPVLGWCEYPSRPFPATMHFESTDPLVSRSLIGKGYSQLKGSSAILAGAPSVALFQEAAQGRPVIVVTEKTSVAHLVFPVCKVENFSK